MFDVIYNQFFSNLDQKIITFVTNPVEVSLKRFRNKLLYNFTNRILDDKFKNRFFVTLTFDEPHYLEILKKKQSFSGILRRKIDFILRRKDLKHPPLFCLKERFAYASRLERGQNKTERLHVHMIILTNESLERIRYNFMRYWDLCQWDKLDIQNSFCLLDDSAELSMYVCKYASKSPAKFRWQKDSNEKWHKIEVTAGHFAHTRHENYGRSVNTSRHFQKIPSHLYMKFDWEVKIWQTVVKNNWRQNPSGEWINFAPYVRIAVKSFHKLEKAKDFFTKLKVEERLNEEMCPFNELDVTEQISIRTNVDEYKKWFSYDFSKLRKARCYQVVTRRRPLEQLIFLDDIAQKFSRKLLFIHNSRNSSEKID